MNLSGAFVEAPGGLLKAKELRGPSSTIIDANRVRGTSTGTPQRVQGLHKEHGVPSAYGVVLMEIPWTRNDKGFEQHSSMLQPAREVTGGEHWAGSMVSGSNVP